MRVRRGAEGGKGRSGIIGVLLTAALVMAGWASAAHGSVGVPSVTTPQVDVPSIRTPSITTPIVSTPVATIPSVSTPSVSTPPVNTPPVPTPPVTVPSVPAPVPSVPVPAVAAPSLPTPAVTAPSSPAPRATQVPIPRQSSPPATGSARPAAGEAAPQARPAGSGTAAVSSATHAATTSGAERRTEHRGRRLARAQAVAGWGGLRPPSRRAGSAVWTRYLRRLVHTLGGCLASLTPGARQILIWRTGLGGGRTFTERQAATRLGTTVAHERRLEQTAAIALRLAAGTGRCGRSPAPATVVSRLLATAPRAAVQDIAGAAAPSSAASSGAAPSTGSAPPPRSQPGRASSPHIRTAARSGRARRRARPTVTVENSAFPALAHPSGGFPWLLVLAALAVVVGVSLLVERRSELALGRAVAGAALRVRPAAKQAAPADEIGDPQDVVRFGEKLESQGDVEGAIAAYAYAARYGHPGGAVSLGVLLAEQGDVSRALDAFRRADRLGDAAGAFNLGVMLEAQGDREGAIGAFTRAQSTSAPGLAEKARAAVAELSRRPPG